MRFSNRTEQYYIGIVRNCYLGYSNDLEIRKHAASGGIASTLLIYLMESGRIDGAVTSRLKLDGDAISGKSYIAGCREEILSSGGSIYSNVSPLSLDRIKEFPGKLAIVGLPCYINKYNRLSKKHKVLEDKITLKIGLFCGHNSRKDLINHVLRKKNIKLDDIERFYFRRGRWRGNVDITLKSGEIIRFPFSHFSIYQNLHFYSQRKCMFCTDHTAESADISCGDAWLRRMKKKPIKHSIFLSRTQSGEDIINDIKMDGRIVIEPSTPHEVFISQKRALIHHKSIKARACIGKWFGYSINDNGLGNSQWNDYLAVLISITNQRWSERKQSHEFIFKIPRPILFLYLLLFKLLTNF